MKFNKLICFFIIILSLTVGCDDKDDAIAPFLSVRPQTINLQSGSTTYDLSVKTSFDDWSETVDSDAQMWLKTSRSGSTLKIDVSENNNAASRKANIKIVAGSLSESISIEQLGIESNILVSSDIFTVSPDGEQIELKITSNVEYEVIIPSNALWIEEATKSRTSEMITEEYYFDVEWNREDAERRAELIIKETNGTLEKKVLVIQKAQDGYSAGDIDEIKDDFKVAIRSAWASSEQANTEIEKSFDNNYSTNYHSSWNNNNENYFPITLEYHFENQEKIDYFIYHPRTSGGSNGNFKEVEVWAKTKTDLEFIKLLDYDFQGSGNPTKVVFENPLLGPETVRFVVKSGEGPRQGFASCSEMEFYAKHPENFDPLQLFTDMSCSELRARVTIEDIENVSNTLYRNIAYYLFINEYPSEFRIQEYRAWPHPREWADENKTATLSLLDNPTGIVVPKVGDKLIVFVGNTYGQSISIKIQDLDTPGDSGYGNASFYPLTEGVNVIKSENKGLVYVFYHSSDYANLPPIKIHFPNGDVNGYYDSQKHKSTDWTRLLNSTNYKYFDVLGEHAHLTFETSAFKSYAADDGHLLIDAYDDLVRLEKEFMGLMKYNRPTNNRAYFHVIYTSYMYSTAFRTAYNSSTQKNILTLRELKENPWGPAHEMGHSFQTRPGFRWVGMAEVTNNVHSQYVLTEWGNESRLEDKNTGGFNSRYEKAFNNSFIDQISYPAEEDVFCKLVSLWQLQLYFANAKRQTDIYKDFYEIMRTSPDLPTVGEQQLEFVRSMCKVTQVDLTQFFKRWGYLTPVDMEVSDYSKAQMKITQKDVDNLIADIKSKGYPEVGEKIEYITDSNWKYFRDKLPVVPGTVKLNGSRATMTNWKNVVAYEVYNNNKLIFISHHAEFDFGHSSTENIKIYAVAFDGAKTEVSI